MLVIFFVGGYQAMIERSGVCVRERSASAAHASKLTPTPSARSARECALIRYLPILSKVYQM